MKKILTSVLLICAVLNVFSQITDIDRIEFDQRDDWSTQDTYIFGEDGVIVTSTEDKPQDRRKVVFAAQHFNTDLEKTKSVQFSFDRVMLRKTVERENEAFYIAGYNYKSGEIKVVAVMKDLMVYEYNVSTDSRLIYDDFEVTNDQFIISLYSKRKRSTLVYGINRENEEISLLYTMKRTRERLVYSLRESVVTKDGEDAYMVYDLCNKGRCFSQHIVKVSSGDMIEGPEKMDIGEKLLVDITLTRLEDGNIFLSGTYGEAGSANGIAYGKMTELGQFEFYNTVNFTDLKNFFNYLPERTQEKIARKKARRSRRGQELEINYRIACHDIEWINGEFVLVGEAYYPTYRTETTQTYNAATGGYTTTTRTVFDGYQYTHAMLIGISPDGELKYENILEMSVWPKPYSVKQYVVITSTESTVRLMYQVQREIEVKEYENGEIVDEKTYKGLDGDYENDKVLGTLLATDIWYDNYIISYGLERIKNTRDKDVRRRRTVYVLQKSALNTD